MAQSDRFFQSVALSDVVLRVGNLETMRAFYRDLLGLQVVTEESGYVALSPNGHKPALVVLEAAPDAPLRVRGASGLFHAAFLYPDRASLGRIARRLMDAGVHVATGDHGVSEALYLDDPEGNGIELYADRPPEQWPKKTNPGDALGMYTEAVDLDSVLAEGERTPGPIMPANVRLGHVHLSVADLAATERFYTQVLGFGVTVRSFPGALFLGRDGYHHHLGTNIWRSRAPVTIGARGLARFTIHFSQSDDLSHVSAALALAPQTEPRTVHDPSGIEIVVTS